MLSSCPICRRPLQPVLTDRSLYALLGEAQNPVSGFQAYSCGPKGHIVIIAAGANGSSRPGNGSDGSEGMKLSLLNSWKEIAGYLGRGVRTVQRWELDLGLPIHRPKGKDRSAVLAFAEELDEWLHKTPVRSQADTPVRVVLPSPAQPRRTA